MNRLNELTILLEANGFSYEANTRGVITTVSVELDAPVFVLPGELQPYAIAPQELERYMWKGNSSKQSEAGAELEYALRGWLHHRLENDPRSVPLKVIFDELLARPADTEEQRAVNRADFAK